MIRFAAIALLAGCSNILGIEGLSGPDNNPPVDGPGGTDVPVGDQITVTLTVRIFDGAAGGGDQPLPNANVDFIRLPGGMRLASAATDDTGRVMLPLPTSGMPLDGFFRVEGSAFNGVQYATTSFYPLPLAVDTNTSFSILTDPVLDMFAMSLGEARSPNAAFVFIFVAQPGSSNDPTMTIGRPGIRVSGDASDRVRYDSLMGPDPNATQTSDQGTAYIVNAIPSPSKQLRAVEAVTNRDVGTRVLDVRTPRTVHFALVPTTP